MVRNNVVFYSMFTLSAPFAIIAIRCRFSISHDTFHTYSLFQCSLFKVRYSLFAAPFAIRTLFAAPFAIRCHFSMSPDAFNKKKTANGEWPGESRFAIQCSPRCSLFGAPFPIYFLKCSLFKVRYSIFAVRRAVRHSPRHSPRRSPFAAPFAIRLVIRCAVRHSPRRFLFIFAIQTSLFNVRRAVSH